MWGKAYGIMLIDKYVSNEVMVYICLMGIISWPIAKKAVDYIYRDNFLVEKLSL